MACELLRVPTCHLRRAGARNKIVNAVAHNLAKMARRIVARLDHVAVDNLSDLVQFRENLAPRIFSSCTSIPISVAVAFRHEIVRVHTLDHVAQHPVMGLRRVFPAHLIDLLIRRVLRGEQIVISGIATVADRAKQLLRPAPTNGATAPMLPPIAPDTSAPAPRLPSSAAPAPYNAPCATPDTPPVNARMPSDAPCPPRLAPPVAQRAALPHQSQAPWTRPGDPPGICADFRGIGLSRIAASFPHREGSAVMLCAAPRTSSDQPCKTPCAPHRDRCRAHPGCRPMPDVCLSGHRQQHSPFR